MKRKEPSYTQKTSSNPKNRRILKGTISHMPQRFYGTRTGYDTVPRTMGP